MRRLIRKEVEDPLALEILSTPRVKNQLVCIEAAKNGLKIKIKNPDDEKTQPQEYVGRLKCDVL